MRDWFSRFVLALAALALLWFPFALFLGSPGPLTIIPVLSGLAVLVAVPLTVVFVWRSWSVEHLYAYLLAVITLTIVFGFFGLVLHSLYISFTSPDSAAAAGPGFAATTGPHPLELVLLFGSILAVYVLAFHPVYRGGYARLKARLA